MQHMVDVIQHMGDVLRDMIDMLRYRIDVLQYRTHEGAFTSKVVAIMPGVPMDIFNSTRLM